MADETTTVVAESSPAVVHPEEMNDTQRSEWLRTGTHPEIKPSKAEPAPAGEKKAASPPAEKRKTADDRKLELSADIKDLLSKRGVLKEDDFWKDFEEFRKTRSAKPVAESQPAPQVNEPKPPERPKRPDLAEFKTTAEYEAAMDKYDAAVETYQAQKAAFATATADAKANQEKLEAKLKEGWERVTAKYPDAKDVSTPIFQALMANAKAMPEVTWFLNNTEVLPDMLYVLGGKFKLDEFLELGKTNAPKALRLLLTMENDIIAELAKSAVPEKEPAPRETKKVTQAPEPPKEVGGKASVPEDAIKTAVARRDFSTFANEANKRDIQRRRQGR